VLGLPLVLHDIEAGGRTWRVEAVADQSRLAAMSDRFVHFPFGLLLWDSAPVLAAALAERRHDIAGRSVLELGAGVGLAGIVARALGADVLQTDHAAEALALAAANAQRNGVEGITRAIADWTDWRVERQFDLIIGSDILYEPALHDALQAVLVRNLTAEGRLLLTDPGRSTTPAFIGRLETTGWSVTEQRRTAAAIAPSRPGETVTVTVIDARRRAMAAD